MLPAIPRESCRKVSPWKTGLVRISESHRESRYETSATFQPSSPPSSFTRLTTRVRLHSLRARFEPRVWTSRDFRLIDSASQRIVIPPSCVRTRDRCTSGFSVAAEKTMRVQAHAPSESNFLRLVCLPIFCCCFV